MQPTVIANGQRIEAAAFSQRILRAASALRDAGLEEGGVVALLLPNGAEALEIMLAARGLGARWCPINWHFKTEEVQYILHNCGARLWVADAGLLQRLPGLDTRRLTTLLHGDGADTWARQRDAAPPFNEPAHAPRGAMFYTSGTTGRPKGILREAATPEQAARSQAVLRQVLGLTPGMRALVSAPMYHSAPNSYCVGASLDDATLFIEARFDAERTLQLIETHRLTHAYLVPTMYVRLLALPPAVRQRYDLSSMRFVASTGSPCPPDVKRAMIEWWGPVIHEAYGASELGYMTLQTSEDALSKPGSAGRLLPGVEITIRDDEGRVLPQGQAGLIYVRQPAFANFSYIGNDEARQRIERDGMLTLGDIGYLDEDGFLFIVDRSADMVISGGVNIYPAEIEAVLLGLPGVADAAVFGIPDDEFGEALAAAVQLRHGETVTAEQVRSHLSARLAGYKVPRAITFHEQLPREDSGKIFKRLLREPYWAGRSRRV